MVLGALLLALRLPADAQRPAKVPRIGWLTGSQPFLSNAHRTDAFRLGLRELGYVEGNNIVIEWRGADGNRDRQRALAVELVRLKVDAHRDIGWRTNPCCQRRNRYDSHCVCAGYRSDRKWFLCSPAWPDRAVTLRACPAAPELTGKQVELLDEVVPKALPAGRLCHSKQSELRASVKKNRTRRRSVKGYAPIPRRARSQGFEAAFREASKGRADAVLWVVSGNVASPYRKKF